LEDKAISWRIDVTVVLLHNNRGAERILHAVTAASNKQIPRRPYFEIAGWSSAGDGPAGVLTRARQLLIVDESGTVGTQFDNRDMARGRRTNDVDIACGVQSHGGQGRHGNRQTGGVQHLASIGAELGGERPAGRYRSERRVCSGRKGATTSCS